MKRSIVVLVSAALVAGAVAVSTVALGASDSSPTKGRIPDEAFESDDRSLVPEYIETIDSEGNLVGYTHRDWAYPDAAAAQRQLELYGPRFLGDEDRTPPFPVYGEDLETVVGHLYGGVGFVPLGEEPGPPQVTVVEGSAEDPLD